MAITGEIYSGPRVKSQHRLNAGLVRPFVRTSNGDFASSQGPGLVMSNVGQVLGTAKGTLPWRPEFGSSLDTLRHRANTPGLRELASHYVGEALGKWEPRANLKRVTVAAPTADTQNLVDMKATIAIDGETEQSIALSDRTVTRHEGVAEAYSLTGGGRVARGLAYLTETYEPVKLAPVRLRTGLSRLFRRERDFLSLSGAALIRSNVGQVLGTERGTLPWNPEFGSSLQRLRHQANTPGLRELVRVYVEEAVKKWEPTAEVVEVDIVESADIGENGFTIRVLSRQPLFNAETPHAFDVAVK